MFWIILLCILGIIVAVFMLSVRFDIKYDSSLTMSVSVLFVKLGVYPDKGPKYRTMTKKQLEKLSRKLKKKDRKKSAEKRQKQHTDKSGDAKSMDVVTMVNDMSMLVLAVLKRFFRHLKINIRQLDITVAAGDAAKTAVAYGAVTQAVSYMLCACDNYTNLSYSSSDDINVKVDYLKPSFEAAVDIQLRIRVWQALCVLLYGLINYFKKNMKSGGKINGKQDQ